MTKLLFVCMGNICRSPLAEGICRAKAQQLGLLDTLFIDSAGTHGYHPGASPDQRAQMVATSHGIDISGLRARQVQTDDLVTFDYVLAMDNTNYHALQTLSRVEQRHKIQRLLDFATELPEDEVPDPYYGEQQDFVRVFELVTIAVDGLLRRLQQQM